ncbi:MAG: coiled-coil domain-containing protein [Candidatus Brocadiales bacterium]
MNCALVIASEAKQSPECAVDCWPKRQADSPRQKLRKDGVTPPLPPAETGAVCHSERSEESSILEILRSFHSLRMTIAQGFSEVSSLRFISLCFIFLLVQVCGSPLFAGDTDKLTEIEKEFIAQHRLYGELEKKFDHHPVTKWRREIARNKRAIAVLEKQLRDMVRFENEEQIEELKRENKKLQKQIETKKEEWEALGKKFNAAKKHLKSLKKQLDPTRAEEILKDQRE